MKRLEELTFSFRKKSKDIIDIYMGNCNNVYNI